MFENEQAVEHISTFFKLRQSSDFIEIFNIQPTFANEKRHYDYEIINEQNQALNVTVKDITHSRIYFELFNPTANKDTLLIINGSLLGGVFVDNVSITEGSGAETSTWDFNPTVLPFFGQLNTLQIDNDAINVTISFPSNTNIVFAEHGASLEGTWINNFTKMEFDRIQGLAEHYNLLEENINKIINFTTLDLQKAYEIAGKLNDTLGFTPESNLTKAGQAYIDGIGNATTFAEIFDEIEKRIRNETGSGGAGDNPDFGVERPEN